jgi:hypothetical protein
LIEINETTLEVTNLGNFKAFSENFDRKWQIEIFQNLLICLDHSNITNRIFASEISPNLKRENISNSTFTPMGFFSPNKTFREWRSFGFSYDGSFSFLGG